MKDFSILYVEDDFAVQKYISEFLERYCCEVYLAQTAEDGYDLYCKYHPHIVMLDINLPSMSGIDLAEKIRLLSSNVHIIMATAYTDKEFLLQAIELNLIRYLIKPITSDDLYDVFTKCITSNPLNQELKKISLDNEYSYHFNSKELFRSGKLIVLRKKEIALLEFFINNSHQIVSYEVLESMVWKDMQMTQAAIRSQIKNLRKKIHPKFFTNISGVGYKFEYGKS